jgi:hypothetical protein
MVARTLTAQLKPDFKSVGKCQTHHPPDHHEAAATVKIIVQTNAGFPLWIDDARQAAFSLPGGKDLPFARIVKQRMEWGSLHGVTI